MKSAFLIIATGPKYIQYAVRLIESIREYIGLKPQVIAFTDKPQALQQHARVFTVDPMGYPEATLMRYHTILSKEHILRQEGYQQLFYVDADMLFVDDVKMDEIESPGLMATLHPGYVGARGTPETNPASTAFCNNTYYYCGGFQGGEINAYLSAAKVMAENIDTDKKNGVMARWHDESHWNKYLTTNPIGKRLDPSFCYPEAANDFYKNKWAAAGLNVKPRLLALTKRDGR